MTAANITSNATHTNKLETIMKIINIIILTVFAWHFFGIKAYALAGMVLTLIAIIDEISTVVQPLVDTISNIDKPNKME